MFVLPTSNDWHGMVNLLYKHLAHLPSDRYQQYITENDIIGLRDEVLGK